MNLCITSLIVSQKQTYSKTCFVVIYMYVWTYFYFIWRVITNIYKMKIFKIIYKYMYTNFLFSNFKFIGTLYFHNMIHDILFWFQIEARGGKCIPVQCDHSKDEEVEKLFERVKSEQNGQLDVLVNNAYSAVTVSVSIFFNIIDIFCL